jgi:hypothetical protein
MTCRSSLPGQPLLGTIRGQQRSRQQQQQQQCQLGRQQQEQQWRRGWM